MRSRYALAVATLLLSLAAGLGLGLAARVAHGDALRVSGDVVRVVIEFADGSSQVLEAQPPTATPSVTPPPTNTPRPTDTVTPAIEPTPTPEIIPATPGPIETPTPICAVKLGENGIRLRAAPTTGAAILDVLGYGTVQTVYEWQLAGGYLWARNTRGWFATYQTSWWVYGVEQTEACVDVPGWPEGWTPPAALVSTDLVRVGFKATPGASADVLIDFARRLPDGVGAVVFVVQDTELATRLHAAGIYTVFVPWSQWPGDCPSVSMAPATSANNRIRYVEQQLGAAVFDAVVLSNECHWPDATWYAAWAMAAMDECDARGWVCAPTVWNPGAPDLNWLPELDTMHCELARRGHYYGANIYPYWPVDLLTRTLDTAYTTWRHEIIQDRMQCAPSWMVTELAPDGGGWLPDVAGTAAYIRATAGKFGFVGAWYYAGGNRLPGWPDAAWSAADVMLLAGLVEV